MPGVLFCLRVKSLEVKDFERILKKIGYLVYFLLGNLGFDTFLIVDLLKMTFWDLKQGYQIVLHRLDLLITYKERCTIENGK